MLLKTKQKKQECEVGRHIQHVATVLCESAFQEEKNISAEKLNMTQGSDIPLPVSYDAG
jgi:hypothetical protein